MQITKEGVKLLHDFEGLKLTAYLCPAAKALPPAKQFYTIGYGNTFYEDGRPVKMGDRITKERAVQLFDNVVAKFGARVLPLLRVPVKPNQFSALVSFAYNVGVGNLQKSTLLKRVNANPSDPDIRSQFLRWNRAGGRELAGLTRRREAEARLYFS